MDSWWSQSKAQVVSCKTQHIRCEFVFNPHFFFAPATKLKLNVFEKQQAYHNSSGIIIGIK